MAILGFKCEETRRLYTTGRSVKFRQFERTATRKLAQLDAAQTLAFLQSPPGNRFERLSGDRAGSYNIRVNDQWRLCFVWTEDGPVDVEIIDYH